jgi:glycosyltransferase involved in cell wall biosynthesis
VSTVHSSNVRSRRSATGRRIILLTNVRQSILDAYVAPLARLDSVEEIVLVRDRVDVDLGPKTRVVTTKWSWATKTLLKIPIRQVLLSREAKVALPDLFMTIHWFPDGPFVARRAQLLNVPFVANIIGGYAELVDGGRRFALSRLPAPIKSRLQEFQRRVLNRAAVITYTGHSTARAFRAAGVNEPASVVLRAAITSFGSPPSADNRPTDVVFIGRIDRDKRADRLFAVLAELARLNPTYTAEIIGVDERRIEADPTYRTARSLMGSRLRLYSRVPKVEELLLRSKIILVTSDTEGKALVTLEGMACGAVPVVTEVGDLREGLANGAAGIVVSIDTNEAHLVRSLAESVSALLKDEPRRALLAARGYSHVRAEHDARCTADDWQRVLDLTALRTI